MNGSSVLGNGMSVWLAVLLCCGGVFLYINSGNIRGEKNSRLLRAVKCGCYDRERIQKGQWWRMVTVGFVHIEPWHIMMNLYALYNLRYLEIFFGHAYFALLLFSSVFCGSLLEYFVSKTRYSVGLSGGLYGLMFSYFLLLITFRSTSGIRSLLLILVLNLAINFLPNIAWEAHIGGALAGMVLTEVFLLLH